MTGPTTRTRSPSGSTRRWTSTPQPGGPTRTSTASGTVAMASTSPARFLRGSATPTQRTTLPWSPYRDRRASTPTGSAARRSTPSGTTQIRSVGMPASTRSAAVAADGHSTQRARPAASSHASNIRRPRLVKWSGRWRHARSWTVATRGALVAGTAPPVAWTRSGLPHRRSTPGRPSRAQDS